jgi:hypothetical protein
MQQVPPKRWYLYTDVHGVNPQKIGTFISTAVRTSNLALRCHGMSRFVRAFCAINVLCTEKQKMGNCNLLRVFIATEQIYKNRIV